jgi:glycosyltransferase involved in cell wall biosynthesis
MPDITGSKGHLGLDRKHLAIAVFFHAPLGGLQENVLATARAAIQSGWKVTVICPPGPFIDGQLRPIGVNTLAIDFQSESSTATACQLLRSADIIHAHPGPSLTLALDAADTTDVPVVFTIHGAWFDNVQHRAQRLAAIVCVSPAVQEAVMRLCPDHAERIVCVPNGVDTRRFSSASVEPIERGHVVVASRLDADKRVLVDAMVGLWEAQVRKSAPQALYYTIAGHGTLQGELELAAERLAITVHFVGWLETSALARLFNRAAVVIASGRAALESLAAGRPTLALASAGAAEAFESAQLAAAAYSNFGGFGAQPVQSFDSLFERLCAVAARTDATFASQACDFVLARHDNAVTNQQLLDLYERTLGAATVGCAQLVKADV